MMRLMIAMVCAAAALGGCASSEKAEKSHAGEHTDWAVVHTASCIPPGGSGILDACCRQFSSAVASDDKSALHRYLSFARGEVWSRIVDNALDGRPVPDITGEVPSQAELIGFLEGYCGSKPNTPHARAVVEFWRQMPKPVETAGMTTEELTDLVRRFEREVDENAL